MTRSLRKPHHVAAATRKAKCHPIEGSPNDVNVAGLIVQRANECFYRDLDVLELLAAIRKGAIEQLRAIPGIGPKMSGRLVLELKEKAIALDVTTTHLVKSAGDAVYEDTLSALINLGYPERETRRAIDRILNEANAPTY